MIVLCTVLFARLTQKRPFRSTRQNVFLTPTSQLVNLFLCNPTHNIHRVGTQVSPDYLSPDHLSQQGDSFSPPATVVTDQDYKSRSPRAAVRWTLRDDGGDDGDGESDDDGDLTEGGCRGIVRSLWKLDARVVREGLVMGRRVVYWGAVPLGSNDLGTLWEYIVIEVGDRTFRRLSCRIVRVASSMRDRDLFLLQRSV